MYFYIYLHILNFTTPLHFYTPLLYSYYITIFINNIIITSKKKKERRGEES